MDGITMRNFDKSFTRIETFRENGRKPNFDNLRKVLSREKPDRFTLFEFFLNDGLYDCLTSGRIYDKNDHDLKWKKVIDAYHVLGYDFATIIASDFDFPSGREEKKGGIETITLNEGSIITDRASFERYRWPDADAFDYSRLDRLANYLPDGMKLIVWGPGGVLENVIKLVGFENMCLMTYDDPELLQQIFDRVGGEFVKYYSRCSYHPAVAALISNDDWGFNTQTMLSVKEMRRYVVPWHIKIAEVIHATGKPALLHSCGNLEAVMDDVIDVIGYQGKHSYEDKILPVERAYDLYANRIAILGGLDVDFLCRSAPDDVYARACFMLEKTGCRGYALGSGNSIPNYVPEENYLAMIAAAVFNE